MLPRKSFCNHQTLNFVCISLYLRQDHHFKFPRNKMAVHFNISLFIFVTLRVICNHHENKYKECSFSNKTSLSLVFRISPISKLFSFLWVIGFFMSLNTSGNILINDLVLEIKPKGIYITFISWKMNIEWKWMIYYHCSNSGWY